MLDSMDKKLRRDIKGKGRADEPAGQDAEDEDNEAPSGDDEASSDHDEAAGNKALPAASPKASSSGKSVGKHPQNACDFCKRGRSEVRNCLHFSAAGSVILIPRPKSLM